MAALSTVMDDHDRAHDPAESFDTRVLVLDASWQPASVIPWQRAVTLLLDLKAEAIVESERMISSPSVALWAPAVIRVPGKTLAGVRRKPQSARKRAIFARDRWTCAYCGEVARTISQRDALTLDHVHPKSRGGSNTEPINLVTACKACNGRKGDLTPEEAGMPLLFPPRELTWSDRARLALGDRPNLPESWTPYLAAVA